MISEIKLEIRINYILLDNSVNLSTHDNMNFCSRFPRTAIPGFFLVYMGD